MFGMKSVGWQITKRPALADEAKEVSFGLGCAGPYGLGIYISAESHW